ncbi:hypothetical protein ABY42_06440 [Haloferax gibbonsii]|uniref:Uncharacterized protein n=2 Tax=Haloferax gibbonsii TaxID=35746 RepID=A0A0K1IWX5_HALGI|nr:hypothetical protein ABY42_06440 [Haloferax gibbonsii]
MHEEGVAGRDAERAEVRGERLDGSRLVHALDRICFGHTRPSAGPGFNLWCRSTERSNSDLGDAFGMSRVSARDALRYATEDDAIALFAVILGGWVFLTVGSFALAGYGFGLMFALGILASLAGALAMFAGVVGLAYKLLVDSRRAVSE